jgi:hypothetical protein
MPTSCPGSTATLSVAEELDEADVTRLSWPAPQVVKGRGQGAQRAGHEQQFNTAKEAFQELVLGKEFEGGKGYQGHRAQLFGAANGLLLDIQNRTQPGYFGADDIYKKIQLEALSRSPLEEKLLDINNRQLEALLQQINIMRKQEGEPPVPRLG